LFLLAAGVSMNLSQVVRSDKISNVPAGDPATRRYMLFKQGPVLMTISTATTQPAAMTFIAPTAQAAPSSVAPAAAVNPYDFSAFVGAATNGAQGGLSPINQPDPNYNSYDFSAFAGASSNGMQGGLPA